MVLRVAERLANNCRKQPETALWLERLPDTVRELTCRWSLTLKEPVDGDETCAAWVTRVALTDGTFAVLKVGMPHMEGEHEIHGLRYWDGDPTVRLLNADVGLNAMLLEECEPGKALRTLPEREQDAVIIELLPRLWRTPAAPHPFRPLSTMLSYWADETLKVADRWPDEGLVREGLRLFRELPLTAPAVVLLATDLHAGNVLRARREPWLVIDPKPFVGDPAYDATQHLLNCPVRLRTDPDRTIRRLAEGLGLDHERVRHWTFARIAASPSDWTGEGWVSLARALAP